MTGQRRDAAAAPNGLYDYEFPDLYAAYRDHLDHCPRRHLGLLADCVEGTRLRAAWTGERTPRCLSSHTTGARADA